LLLSNFTTSFSKSAKTIRKLFKNDPKTIQKPSKNDPITIQKRSKNDLKTIQKLSKNYPKTVQKLSKNDPKTIQKLSQNDRYKTFFIGSFWVVFWHISVKVKDCHIVRKTNVYNKQFKNISSSYTIVNFEPER